MRQIIHIIRKVDVEKLHIITLNYELDYELANLHEAIQQNDKEQIKKSNERLKEIHAELTTLGVLV